MNLGPPDPELEALTARSHTPLEYPKKKMKYPSTTISPALLVDALDDFPAKGDRSVIR